MNLLSILIEMDLLILSADNFKEMEDISQELSQKKFRIIRQDDNYI